MTEIVVSPLPKWILDTFEGQLLRYWIGYKEQDDLVVFDGDTEGDDEEDIILLELKEGELAALADLADEAGTTLCKSLAALLRDPVNTGVMNDYFGAIDITCLRCEAGIVEDGENVMMDPDHLLHSLVSRFPEEIPYVETSWHKGGTFITPSGIEFFKTQKAIDTRRKEHIASHQTAPSVVG
jgi:hypothetical protein